MRNQEHRIVVGVDGSESSKAALRWAIVQAKLTGAPVDAVTAWRYPAGYGWTPVTSELDFEGDAKRALTEALGEVSGLDPEVPVRPLVAEGNTAEVLLRTADLRARPAKQRGRFPGDDPGRSPREAEGRLPGAAPFPHHGTAGRPSSAGRPARCGQGCGRQAGGIRRAVSTSAPGAARPSPRWRDRTAARSKRPWG
jgi:Universal stress protein family